MDAEEIKLERQRLRIETRLRRAEQKLQRDQWLASQSTQRGWKVIFTPVGAAIGAAVIGICGTAASKWFDLKIERQKQETTVILKASEVPIELDEKNRSIQRAQNVVWFAEAGYIHLPKAFLEKLRQDAQLSRGEIPSGPVVQPVNPNSPEAKKTTLESGMAIDADGGYHTYHPDGAPGLDHLANAGSPGNWYALVTDSGEPNGNPVVQSATDPAPGYYISTTELQDVTKARSDPRRYVNSEDVPYVAFPRGKTTSSLGDICVCYRPATKQYEFAIHADSTSPRGSPAGSVALAQALGVPSNPKTGGTERGVIYYIFPGSGNGQPKTAAEIRTLGAKLLEQWGGKAALETLSHQ